jgi:hypothetical protein
MGFADSFGQHLCFMFVTAWVFLLIAIKLFKTVDDSGEVRKTANERFAEWLTKLFQKK